MNKRILAIFSLMILLIVVTTSQAFATTNYFLINKNYYQEIEKYEAGFLKETIKDTNLAINKEYISIRKVLDPLSKYLVDNNPLAGQMSITNFIEDKVYPHISAPENNYKVHDIFFKKGPSTALNNGWIGKTYHEFYMNKKIDYNFSAENSYSIPSIINRKYTKKLSPEDTNIYLWPEKLNKWPDRNDNRFTDANGDMIYGGFSFPTLPRDNEYIVHPRVKTAAYRLPVLELKGPIYFSYLYLGNETNNDNAMKFSQENISPYNIGYDSRSKLPDVMLTKTNNFVIPARYNTNRDDILMVYRGRFDSFAGRPNITINVLDENNNTVGNNKNKYSKFEFAFNINDILYHSNLSTASKASRDAFFDLVKKDNTADGSNINTKLKTYLDNYRAPNKPVSASIGFKSKLNVFFRDSLEDQNQTALSRKNNMDYKYTINHNIVETSDSNRSLLYNPAEYSVVFTRPAIIDNAGNSVELNIKANDFDEVLGVNSISIIDNGVKNEEVNGVAKSVEIDTSRIRVSFRQETGSTYSAAKTIDELKLELAKASNAGKRFELIYTYVPTDSSDQNLGKLPQEIKDGTGPYAAPFYRKVKVVSKEVQTSIERIAGNDRFSTATEISKRLKSKSNAVILVNSTRYPDSLTASVLSKKIDAPILLTKADSLTNSVQTEIDRLGAKKLYLIGGNAVLTDELERNLKTKYEVERIGGPTRYETAELVAQRIGGNNAIVARGDEYPDALTVSSLALKELIPIYLTRPNMITSTTIDEIKKRNPTMIYIAGGNIAVSSEIEQNLKNIAGVKRFNGESRFSTAVEISKFVFGENLVNIMYARSDDFADAMVGSPLANKYNAAILLTNGDKFDLKIKNYLISNKLKIKKHYIIGGIEAIPNAVELDIREMMK